MSQTVTKKTTDLTSSKSPVASAKPARPSVFHYQDYRQFLKDVIQWRRSRNSSYNMSKFAEALGFSSHAGLAMVLNGKRELRAPYLDKCLQNLSLTVNERLYFEAMVRAGALGPAKRRALLREVQFLSQTWEPPEGAQGIRLIDYGLVHQILCLNRTYMTVPQIIDHFRYRIEAREVQEILDFMAERSQVIRLRDRYKIQTDVLLIKDETPNVSAQQLHRDCLALASHALGDPLEAREFQTYIFTMNSKELPKMKQKIKEMVRQAISEFETDLDADTAVQVHFNLFEVLKPLRSRPGDEKEQP